MNSKAGSASTGGRLVLRRGRGTTPGTGPLAHPRRVDELARRCCSYLQRRTLRPRLSIGHRYNARNPRRPHRRPGVSTPRQPPSNEGRGPAPALSPHTPGAISNRTTRASVRAASSPAAPNSGRCISSRRRSRNCALSMARTCGQYGNAWLAWARLVPLRRGTGRSIRDRGWCGAGPLRQVAIRHQIVARRQVRG